jgi:hypothetical protein
LLLLVQLTGDEQLAIQLRSKLQKHCAALNHTISCSQIPLDIVQLEPFSLLILILLRLLLFDDDEKKIASLVTVTGRLAVDFAL